MDNVGRTHGTLELLSATDTGTLIKKWLGFLAASKDPPRDWLCYRAFLESESAPDEPPARVNHPHREAE
ncbi:MAG: hypothetical protein Q9173_004041 [Seirophora scorigena]